MDALNFSTGVKTFDVNNGAAQISYNPTDVNFVSRLYELFLTCSERYEADKDRKFEDNAAFFEYAKQRDGDNLCPCEYGRKGFSAFSSTERRSSEITESAQTSNVLQKALIHRKESVHLYLDSFSKITYTQSPEKL